MHCLLSQVNVLREIVLHRPCAHLAFLTHKPYRLLYNNYGQNLELCEHFGEWKMQSYFSPNFLQHPCFSVQHVFPFNDYIYHPLVSCMLYSVGLNFNLLKVNTKGFKKGKGESSSIEVYHELFPPYYSCHKITSPYKNVEDIPQRYKAWKLVLEYIVDFDCAPNIKDIKEFY